MSRHLKGQSPDAFADFTDKIMLHIGLLKGSTPTLNGNINDVANDTGLCGPKRDKTPQKAKLCVSRVWVIIRNKEAAADWLETLTWSELLPRAVDLDLRVRGNHEFLAHVFCRGLGSTENLDQRLVIHQRTLEEGENHCSKTPSRCSSISVT